MSRDFIILDFESIVADLSGCYAEAFSTAFRQFDIPYDGSLLEHYISTPLNVLFEKYYKGCTCKYRDFVIMFMGAFDASFNLSRPRPGIADRVRKLKAEGAVLGIISECYEMYAHIFLSANGIEECFSSVVGMDRAAIARPDPYVLRTCMGEMGADPGSTRMVSGSARDREMCGKAGVPVSDSL
ncbi:MAG: HAD hydrolase-like protein [archaeon]|nr:HAD hydrolase-like protein [archaeon]